ncbi:hypothetical protein [Bacteroides sp.]
MNYTHFLKSTALIGILCFVSGCTNNDDPKVQIDYEMVDNIVSSKETIYPSVLEQAPISDILYIGESSQCPIIHAYVFIENYNNYYPVIRNDNDSYLMSDYGYRMNESLSKSDEYTKGILNSDYYGMCPVIFPGEGTYDFAVKIYNPDNKKHYITRPYRLKIWVDECRWHHSISPIQRIINCKSPTISTNIEKL